MIPRLIAAKHLDDVTDRRVPSGGVLTKEIGRRSLQNRELAAKLLMVEQQGVSGTVDNGILREQGGGCCFAALSTIVQYSTVVAAAAEKRLYDLRRVTVQMMMEEQDVGGKAELKEHQRTGY